MPRRYLTCILLLLCLRPLSADDGPATKWSVDEMRAATATLNRLQIESSLTSESLFEEVVPAAPAPAPGPPGTPSSPVPSPTPSLSASSALFFATLAKSCIEIGGFLKGVNWGSKQSELEAAFGAEANPFSEEAIRKQYDSARTVASSLALIGGLYLAARAGHLTQEDEARATGITLISSSGTDLLGQLRWSSEAKAAAAKATVQLAISRQAWDDTQTRIRSYGKINEMLKDTKVQERLAAVQTALESYENGGTPDPAALSRTLAEYSAIGNEVSGIGKAIGQHLVEMEAQAGYYVEIADKGNTYVKDLKSRYEKLADKVKALRAEFNTVYAPMFDLIANTAMSVTALPR